MEFGLSGAEPTLWPESLVAVETNFPLYHNRHVPTAIKKLHDLLPATGHMVKSINLKCLASKIPVW
jgi:hypothetical protein